MLQKDRKRLIGGPVGRSRVGSSAFLARLLRFGFAPATACNLQRSPQARATETRLRIGHTVATLFRKAGGNGCQRREIITRVPSVLM